MSEEEEAVQDVNEHFKQQKAAVVNVEPASNEFFEKTSARVGRLIGLPDEVSLADLAESVANNKAELPDLKGIIGPEYIQGKNMHASLCISEDAMRIDEAATRFVESLPGVPKQRWTPTVFFSDTDSRAVYLRGAIAETKGQTNIPFKPAALVAITPVRLQFIPHALGSGHFEKIEDITLDNGVKLSNQPIALVNDEFVLNEEICITLDLEPGQVFYSHHGTFVVLSSSLDDSPYLIKFISLTEMLTTDPNKKSALRKEMEKTLQPPHAIPSGLHSSNDTMCWALCKALKVTTPMQQPLFDYATLDAFPQFKAKNSGGATAKKEVAVKPESPSADASAAHTKSPKVEPDLIKSYLEEGQALLARCGALHSQPLVWSKYEVKEKPFRGHLEKLSSGNHKMTVITPFLKTMITLKGEVEAAEKNLREKVPEMHAAFTSIESRLNKLVIPEKKEKFNPQRKNRAAYVERLGVYRVNKEQNTFDKLSELVSKLDKQVSALETTLDNKKNKTIRKKAASMTDPSTLIDPNEKLKPKSYQPLIDLIKTKEEEEDEEEEETFPNVRTLVAAYVEDAKVILTMRKALSPVVPEEVAVYLNTWADFAREKQKEFIALQKTTPDEPIAFNLAQIKHVAGIARELNSLKERIDEEYEVYQKTFEERIQKVTTMRPCLHPRRTKVYAGKCEECFREDIRSRMRIIYAGSATWIRLAGKVDGDEVHYIGDSSEEGLWDEFHDQMEELDTRKAKWNSNKADPAACAALDRVVSSMEKLLPIKYHPVNDMDDDDDDDEEEGEGENLDVDSGELKELKENFDVSSEEEESSDYEEDEEEAVSSSRDEDDGKNTKKRDAAEYILDALCDIHAEKERDAALKRYKKGDYDGAVECVEPIYQADTAFGFTMTNKTSGATEKFPYGFLKADDRDKSLALFEKTRGGAFSFSKTQKKLKREREEEEEQE